MESGKDLIIDVRASDIYIALQENGRLVELNKESSTGLSFSVGDTYLGRVKKIMPALNAAFVDIGDEKEAFIHYLDLGLYFTSYDEFVRKLQPKKNAKQLYENIKIGPILEKEGRIEDVLKVGQMIIVQIVKEPISTKGSRLTAEISLAGRNVVLLPFANKVNISHKLSSKEERRRLKTLVKNILPKNYGAIIRTAAEGKNAAVLIAELKALIERWESSWSKLAKSKGVQQLFTEYSKTTTILRDLLNDSFNNIYVNDKEEYKSIKKYVSMIYPELDKIVQYYDGNKPIFDRFDITRQIKSSFGKVVPMKQGAYLVIETTEALHSIDVNSGIRTKTTEQEEHSYNVNKLAAEEVAHQLRLRDMGGIIIIDFIDMDTNEHKHSIYKNMIDLMKDDRAKHNILPITKFGLMQITRQRVRPVTEIDTTEVCPACNGTGKVASSIIIDEQIERKLAYYVNTKNIKSLILKVNPILHSYLTQGRFASRGFFKKSFLTKWKKQYKCKIVLVSDTDFSVLQNEFYTADGVKLDS